MRAQPSRSQLLEGRAGLRRCLVFVQELGVVTRECFFVAEQYWFSGAACALHCCRMPHGPRGLCGRVAGSELGTADVCWRLLGASGASGGAVELRRGFGLGGSCVCERPPEPGSYRLQQPSWLAVCCAVSDGVRPVLFVCGCVGVGVRPPVLSGLLLGLRTGQCSVV